MQRSPKAMLLRPTNVDIPECDCHLPPMESDGRRSRPVINDNNNEVVDTIDDKELEYHQPIIYKKLKQFILRRIIN